MLRCRQVVELVASDAWREAPLPRRLGVWMHLAMCRCCRAYVRQLKRIGEAARRLYGAVDLDPAEAERIIEALRAATLAPPRPGGAERR